MIVIRTYADDGDVTIADDGSGSTADYLKQMDQLVKQNYIIMEVKKLKQLPVYKLQEQLV